MKELKTMVPDRREVIFKLLAAIKNSNPGAGGDEHVAVLAGAG